MKLITISATESLIAQHLHIPTDGHKHIAATVENKAKIDQFWFDMKAIGMNATVITAKALSARVTESIGIVGV